MHYLPSTSQPSFLRGVQDGVVGNHNVGLCRLPPGHQGGVVLDQRHAHSSRRSLWRCTGGNIVSKQRISVDVSSSTICHHDQESRSKHGCWDQQTDATSPNIRKCLKKEDKKQTLTDPDGVSTCWGRLMVHYRAPRTWNLVHVEAHHKLIASVWVQILKQGSLRGAVETKLFHYGHFQDWIQLTLSFGWGYTVSFRLELTLGGSG